MTMKNIILIVLLAVSSHSLAQDAVSAGLQWQASKMIDEAHGVTQDNASVFKTAPGNLQWVQGKITDSFQVTGTNGNWRDITVNGKITFNISDGTDSGTVTIERSAGGIKLKFDISQGSSERLVRTFQIASVLQIN